MSKKINKYHVYYHQRGHANQYYVCKRWKIIFKIPFWLGNFIEKHWPGIVTRIADTMINWNWKKQIPVEGE